MSDSTEDPKHRLPTARSLTRAVNAVTPEALNDVHGFSSDALVELRDKTLPALMTLVNVECIARAKNMMGKPA